ncbi:MAG: S41 family peptidase [Prevotellaceae bacterium]|nr:S41 family peptidase [Prevotellaceae bacterium]
MRKIITLIILAVSVFASAQKKNHNYDVARNLEIFSAIYKNLDMMYVDTLDASEVVGTGIKAMLRSLDPYTEYYASDEVKNLKQMLTGKYAGIGAIVRKNMKTGNVCIDEPYFGMPAQEVGLRKGDEIISIDDSTMIGKDVSYVSSHLRGDAGSTFLLKYKRPGVKKELQVKVKRRAIQLPSVPYFGMLDDNVGYINLTQFTEGCAQEVRRAFIELRQQGMKGFIFDLRNNGGGSLQEAIKIVNLFVPRGLTLVKTKGKMSKVNHEYKTDSEPLDTVMPIVVMVNGSTASASEITAGSLQDLDRAVVFGTRTYGKGLVQMPMDLPHNTSMKVTTSKYYIPSGRCIQAINYKHTGGGYKEHIPDSLTHVFYTANGREVRDGGGIKPDVEFKSDTIPNIAVYLAGSGLDSTEVMFNWVVDYIMKHDSIAKPEEFKLTDEEWKDFSKAVVDAGFKYDRETEKVYDDLIKVAKMEGYYDDNKDEFEALKAKLSHNLARELEKHERQIRRVVEMDIVAHYYYQKGAIVYQNGYDKQLKEAKRLVLSDEEYRKVFQPQQKKGK